MPVLSKPPHDRLRRVAALARYGTVLLLVGFFAATHFPADAIPRQFAAADKLAHCLAYMSLAVSVLTSWELTVGLLRPQQFPVGQKSMNPGEKWPLASAISDNRRLFCSC